MKTRFIKADPDPRYVPESLDGLRGGIWEAEDGRIIAVPENSNLKFDNHGMEYISGINLDGFLHVKVYNTLYLQRYEETVNLEVEGD